MRCLALFTLVNNVQIYQICMSDQFTIYAQGEISSVGVEECEGAELMVSCFEVPASKDAVEVISLFCCTAATWLSIEINGPAE